MKKLIFAVFLLAIFIVGYSQHTLTFNQALLVSNQQTVPPGTVWKVVSIMPSSGAVSNYVYNSSPSVANFSINVNSNAVYFSSVQALASNSGSYYNFDYTNFSGDGRLPMWLPAGTTLAAGSNVLYASVIEFLLN